MNNITNKNVKFNDLEEKVWKQKINEGKIELKYMLQRTELTFYLKHSKIKT